MTKHPKIPLDKNCYFKNRAYHFKNKGNNILYNILLCSAGKRCALVKAVKESLGARGRVVVADMDCTAPALYFADKSYVVPRVDSKEYIDVILDICERESIKAITTLIDSEVSLLAKNKEKFQDLGILLLASEVQTADLCFDRYSIYKIMHENHINTIKTYLTIEEATSAIKAKEISFPVFVKPRYGSGSVGSKVVLTFADLEHILALSSDLIVQEYLTAPLFIDTDIYVDCFSTRVVSIFAKMLLENKTIGAGKTVSFKDDRLFDMIHNINGLFEFAGPIDMDFFCINGKYILADINPRFGGAYVHSAGAGVDFVPLIINNIDGKINEPDIGNYEKNIMMIVYEDFIIKKQDELIMRK